ncbi:MAG: carbon-nitrogen hydrolase family protein [Fidelibacterota bacterium]|nr:MAG: carbon-nitrogen hydrolase family protein [Candidatus Neomarinimicrobiota bacterium]
MIQQNKKSGQLLLAACQFPISASIPTNADWIKQQMRAAQREGAHIVHFPECALSGYAGPDHESLDDIEWQALETQTEAVLALAAELGLWVVLGSTHRLSGEHRPHNCLYLISPEGRIVDRYDKRFCTTEDLEHYSPGDHLVVFEVNGVTCGLLICYDVRFPELYRAYKQRGVQVIFQSFYNARQKKGGIHPKIIPVTAQAHAGINYLYMSLTNSSARHSWPCHFITPDGLIARKLPLNKPGLLISRIDLEESYYDASGPYRSEAMNGKLHSGQTVQDTRSEDRQCY